MDKYEYTALSTRVGGFTGGKVNLDELTETMNQYGKEGWELVSCPTLAEHEGATRTIISVFKRKAQ